MPCLGHSQVVQLPACPWISTRRALASCNCQQVATLAQLPLSCLAVLLQQQQQHTAQQQQAAAWSQPCQLQPPLHP